MMKKLIVLVVASLFAIHAHAQTSKGTVALTATFGYGQNESFSEKEQNGLLYGAEGLNYAVAPSIGVFIKDNLEIGTSGYWYMSKLESFTPSADYSSRSYLQTEYRDKFFGLYARQYKFLTERLAAYVTLSGGLRSWNFVMVSSYTQNSDTTPITTYTKDDQNTTLSAALSPGLSFFASEHIAISFNLGALKYSRHTVDEKYKTEDTRYNLDDIVLQYNSNILEFDVSSINLNLGLTYYIGK